MQSPSLPLPPKQPVLPPVDKPVETGPSLAGTTLLTPAPSAITAAEAAVPFLIHCQVERQYAPESLGKIRECLHSWILPQFGNLPLTSLKPVHILSFRQAMAAANLSVARQYSLLMTLKLFLKFSRIVLEVNCLDPASIQLPKRPTPKVEYLTNSEIQALRDCMDSSRTSGVRLRALFETLLATGMRISEALSLDRDSIAFDIRRATIVGKGGKKRTVFFSLDALHWIKRYTDLRKDCNPALFVTYGTDPKRLKRGDIPRFFKALASAAGVKKHLTPHLLRHTFCTNLRTNGADISLIKELAGHQDIETTARYYLGADTQLLGDAVSRYLNYSAPSPDEPKIAS